jgi:outer membrane receptor protein involved in Fe transport
MKYDFKKNVNANAGLDYNFSNKLSAGFQYIFNYLQTAAADNNNTKIYANPNNLIQTFANAKSKKRGNNFNFHSTYKLNEKGAKIDLNLDYFNYNSQSDRTFETNEYENFSDKQNDKYLSADNGSKQDITNYSAKIDVEQPLKWFNFAYGGKIAFTQNNSNLFYYDLTFGTPEFQQNRSDIFHYNENLQALYVLGSKEFGNWKTQIGLRMENTQTKGISQTLADTAINNYLKIFPTFYLTFTPNDNHSFSFNYSERISRPSFHSLNPFVRYISPYSTSQGNPFLKPSYTNNFELTYTFKDNWNSAIYFTKTEDVRQQVSYMTNENINTKTKHENAYNEYVTGLSESYTFNHWKWIESANSFDIYYAKSQSLFPEIIANYESLGGLFQTNNNFVLNRQKTLFLSANFLLKLPEYNGFYKMKTFANFSAGAKVMFFNQKLSLNLFADDIFRTAKVRNTVVVSGIKSEFSNYEYRQSIRFTIRYTFGNQNIRTKNIKAGNTEEKQRAN